MGTKTRIVNGEVFVVERTPEDQADIERLVAERAADKAAGKVDPRTLMKEKRASAKERIKTANSVVALRQAVMDLLGIE